MSDSRRTAVYSSTPTLIASSEQHHSTSSSRIRETIDSIPTPGQGKHAPKPFQPPVLHLVLAIGSPLVLIVLGIALEIATNVSTKSGGFSVPNVNVFGTVSGQFLASIIPTLIIVPNAVLFRELDWSIRWFQPYLALQKGNASAEESLLLNYVALGSFFSLFHARKYRHRIVFWSCLAALITYTFQPLAGSIFQIRQVQKTDPNQRATSTEVLALSPDIQELNGFLAAAGYVEAASFHGLGDPPFVFRNWATAEFLPLQGPGLNGTVTVNTTAIITDVNCANPASVIAPTTPSPTTPSLLVNLTSVSVDNCTGAVSFDPAAATQQYGVLNVTCGNPPETDQNFQSVMFWYFHMRDGLPEVKTVFCSPTIRPFEVKATAHLEDGRLDSCVRSDDFRGTTNITGPDAPFGGKAFNGLFFNDSPDPFLQARAKAVQSGVSGTAFRMALKDPRGFQAVFDLPNGMLDLTSKIYTQHLAVSARSIYFVPQNDTLTAEWTSFVPRLWIDPLPAHFLALCLVFIGIAGIFIHIIARRQRRTLMLAAPPGSIASTVALTAHSGFGQLLYPYDDEVALEKKLDGIKFRLDKRTGAIVADEEPGEWVPGMGRDDAMLSLLGKHDERFSQHSSSQTAYQAAVGFPPWVYRNPYDPLPE